MDCGEWMDVKCFGLLITGGISRRISICSLGPDDDRATGQVWESTAISPYAASRGLPISGQFVTPNGDRSRRSHCGLAGGQRDENTWDGDFQRGDWDVQGAENISLDERHPATGLCAERSSPPGTPSGSRKRP